MDWLSQEQSVSMRARRVTDQAGCRGLRSDRWWLLGLAALEVVVEVMAVVRRMVAAAWTGVAEPARKVAVRLAKVAAAGMTAAPAPSAEAAGVVTVEKWWVQGERVAQRPAGTVVVGKRRVAVVAVGKWPVATVVVRKR
ncbi:hypothetical protein ACQP2P_24615 [Dactylosporangium sp. CA-139114]|uniref:hypothetical protein n=1 Tax=Dactylosporangium sp. CA-139114 TaxID=3239931 RepID=UPI003D96782A